MNSGELAKKKTPFTFRIRDCSGILRRRYSGKPGPEGMPLWSVLNLTKQNSNAYIYNKWGFYFY